MGTELCVMWASWGLYAQASVAHPSDDQSTYRGKAYKATPTLSRLKIQVKNTLNSRSDIPKSEADPLTRRRESCSKGDRNRD